MNEHTGGDWRRLALWVAGYTLLTGVVFSGLYAAVAPMWEGPLSIRNILWVAGASEAAAPLTLGVLIALRAGTDRYRITTGVLIGVMALWMLLEFAVDGAAYDLSRWGTLALYGVRLVLLAGAVQLAYLHAQRVGPIGWLQAAALLALSPILSWVSSLLMLISIGELTLWQCCIAIGPIAAPVALGALAFHAFGTRWPASLGGHPMRAWAAIVIAVTVYGVMGAVQSVAGLGYEVDHKIQGVILAGLVSPMAAKLPHMSLVAVVAVAVRHRSPTRSDSPIPRSAVAALVYGMLFSASVAYGVWWSGPYFLRFGLDHVLASLPLW